MARFAVTNRGNLLQDVSPDLRVGKLFRYFASCWDQGTGEDPTQPLPLAITPHRSPKRAKTGLERGDEPGNFSIADDDSEMQTALRKF